MGNPYLIGIDQSTQSTKAVLLDRDGKYVAKHVTLHQQIVHMNGWIEHDPIEIARNVILSVKHLLEKTGIDPDHIAGLGVANQRETIVAWDRATGIPVYNAIVWQCNRGKDICRRIEQAGYEKLIRDRTGLKLSPYFSASKISWILEHVPGALDKAKRNELCCGTMDSWVIYNLTNGKHFRTDYSNASRTQLFNLTTLRWDEEICDRFGVPVNALPEVCDSDARFGTTNLDGLLRCEVPIHAAIGDSHGAFLAQGGFERGSMMTGYGTGSCVLLNIGDHPIVSQYGISTSIGWRVSGEIRYVFDGVINYSGAVITWLIENAELIRSPSEANTLCHEAEQEDTTYLIPAFSGVGAPYWESDLRAAFMGMNRRTGKAELVKAAVESIAYQVYDVVAVMQESAGIQAEMMKVSGAPTNNEYLMQFQSNLLNCPLSIPEYEELSAIGCAQLAGKALGIYDLGKLTAALNYRHIPPSMKEEEVSKRIKGWKQSISQLLGKQV